MYIGYLLDWPLYGAWKCAQKSAWTCHVAADGSKLRETFAAKSSAKWQACYTYSINRAPTHAVSLTHAPSLSLSFPLQLACHLSIVYHRRTPQDERRYKFFGFSPFGIVFAFEQTCLLTCNMLHAACGVFMACHKRLSKLHKAIKVKSQITVLPLEVASLLMLLFSPLVCCFCCCCCFSCGICSWPFAPHQLWLQRGTQLWGNCELWQLTECSRKGPRYGKQCRWLM